MSDVPQAGVRVRPNVRRAAILGEEAKLAELNGRPEVAAYLEHRASAWLCGQRY